MSDMILSEVLLDIDNIDHLTILYRRGQGFDRKLAKELIIDFRARYDIPREISPLTPEELDSAGYYALNAELVRLRTAIFEKVKNQ